MAEASLAGLSRRGVLDLLLRVSLIGWLASVLYPVLRYLKPLRQTGPTGPTRLTRAEVVKVEKDKFVIVPIAGQRVLVFEDPSGELRALDAKCTHEGCTVRYLARDALIWCACHNGRFDLEGHVLSGPPPRPLGSHTVVRGEDGSITVAVAHA